MNDVQALVAKLRPTLDEARKVADTAISAVNSLENSLFGTIIAKLPYIGDVLVAAQALDALLDSIDNTIDALAPAATPVVAAVTPASK